MEINQKYLEKVMKKAKRRYTLYTVFIILAIALTAAVFILIFIGRTTPATIVMSDYIGQSSSSLFTGYNGAGEIHVELETDPFKYMMDDVRFNDESAESGKIYLENSGLNEPIRIFYEILESNENGGPVVISPTHGLSNGDVVNIHWTFDGRTDEVDKLFSHLNFDIDYSDMEITVSGLEDPPVLTSDEQIPDTLKDEMQQKAENIFYDDVVSTWDPSIQEVATPLEYLGYIFQCSNDMNHNTITECYKVTENIQGYQEDVPVQLQAVFYWYVKFSDATPLSDGSVYVNTSSYKVPEHTYSFLYSIYDEGSYSLGGEDVWINGFPSYEEMIEDLNLV